MLQALYVTKEDVRHFEVVVKGNNFYSKKVHKVMIKPYNNLTIVQTDKPIYLPGQTGTHWSDYVNKQIAKKRHVNK